ncbi:hypothetical protein FOZ63_012064 [Perkinsus olseni]|uniref:ATP-dependent DNA helicase n=1 Tax=Perkinsus olseni TaxID=32597 RepID=A0A7J6TK77_PEROL|nr:hypothetical protein FOZ63_012064 [Perkinsus olseni]
MDYFSLPFDQSGIVGDNAYMRCARTLRERMVKCIKTDRRKRIASMNAFLVIDEIAAIHSSVLNAISEAFKTIRKGQPEAASPFGGVATLLVGDFLQLGRVEFCATSSKYPPEDYPTGPCWSRGGRNPRRGSPLRSGW